ncbi:MAG TPA: VWA domain-containing protein [Candidatus Angelobacter sp.]|nr:VWA domain-containing protein [Candidatus Angelobacter sp.]
MTKLRSCTFRLGCWIRYLASLFFLIMLPGNAQSQTPSASQDRSGEEYRIRVNAGLVVLHATAQDHKGILVSSLDKENFKVYEDGVLQQIKYFSHEDIPVTVGLVIDNSGSMGNKRIEVIAAALAFARSSNPKDQMFVVNFNEHVRFALAANTQFTDQVSQLEAALSKINANGETALYDAVAAALEHLQKGDRDKKVLIVISDGGDNASKHTLAQVLSMAQQSDAIIYTIGLFDEENDDRNPRVLTQFAKNTGGDVFLPRSLQEAVPICRRIASDIRNQYTIAYVPANRKLDGTYRSIQVRANAPISGHLSVRTRTGYRAPLDP